MNHFFTGCIAHYFTDVTDRIADFLNEKEYRDSVTCNGKPSEMLSRLRKIQERIIDLSCKDISWVNDDCYAADVYDTIEYLMKHVGRDDLRADILSDVEETLFIREPSKTAA